MFKKFNMKTLSIVIPVYNEEERLDNTFRALRELRFPRGLKLEKIIFVDDGSSDTSVAKIKNQISNIKNNLYKYVKIISYPENKGKGYAVSQGMKASKSDYTLFCDADMSTHINEIRKFMPYIRRNMQVIIGTRKNGHSTVVRHQPAVRELFGRIFTYLSSIILNTWVTDFTCGFKAYSYDAKNVLFPLMKMNRWSFDAELLFLGRINGFEYKEVPVVWSDDRRSKVRLWRDVPLSFFDLLHIRLSGLWEYIILNYLFSVRKYALSVVRTIKTFLF